MGGTAVEEIVRDCLAVRVRLIARTVTGLYDALLESHGVTIAQFNLLAALGAAGPCPPSALGEMLQLDRSTISRNLTLLIRHGWAEPASSDAKGMREVTATAAGRAKLEAMMPEWRQAQRQAAELLGEPGVTAVREIAGTVNDFLPAT